MSSETKPSGLKAPSKIGRPSGIAKSSASVTSSRAHSPDGSSKAIDDYTIGDRVFVGGTKVGVIAFLGETKFAAGDWAGVILDELEGKNDGSVQGIRYFQCEPKRGVFSRPSKLTRHKINNVDQQSMPAPLPVAKSKVPATPGPKAIDSTITSTPKPPKSISKTPSTSLPKKNGSISASNTSLSSAALATVGTKHIKIGERVTVNGTKAGTLRYLGTTDFAPGEWAGVELDEAIGKNDGSVAGRRYFDCKPLYGLFAPVHKVTKQGIVAPPTGGRATPSLAQQRSHRLSTTSSTHGLNSRSKDFSVSQESLTSIGSAVSTASRSRVRLGVTSLQGKQTPSPQQSAANRVALARQAYKGVSGAGSSSTAALQKALKEKEEHIEQLIKERELERSEVFKASLQKEEGSDKVTQLQEQLTKLEGDFEALSVDSEFQLNEMRYKLDNLTEEKVKLESTLAEQKTKYEDLQFQMEEEAISRSDHEAGSKASDEAIKKYEDELEQLKQQLSTEKQSHSTALEQIIHLETQAGEKSSELEAARDSLDTYRDQLASLSQSLEEAQSQLQGQQQHGEQADSLSLELSSLQSKLKQTEESSQLLQSDKEKLQQELVSSKQQYTDLESHLSESAGKLEKVNGEITELERSLKEAVEEKTATSTELRDIKLQLSDLQRALEAGESAKASLVDEKSKLEAQIDSLMKNSGDNSQQLTLLNNELRDKERKIETLQQSVREASNQTEKVKDQLKSAEEAHVEELSALKLAHEKTRSQLQENYQRLESQKGVEVDQLTEKLASAMSELSSTNEKLVIAQKSLDDTVTGNKEQVSSLMDQADLLQKTIAEERSNGGKLRTELESCRVELDSVTSTKSMLEEQVSSLTSCLEQVKSEREDTVSSLQNAVEKHQSDLLQGQQELDNTNKELGEVKVQLGSVSAEKDNLQVRLSELEVESNELKQTSESLQQQLEAEKRAKDAANSTKQLLEAELSSLKKETEEKSFELTEQLLSLKTNSEELASKLESAESEKQLLIGQLNSEKANFLQSQEALQKAEKSVKEQKKNLKKAQEEKESLQTQVFSLEEASVTSAESIKSLSSDLAAQNKKMKSLEKDLDKAAKRAELADTTHTAELEAKQQEIEIQTSTIEKYEIEIKHLKSQISLSTSDSDTIRQLRERLCTAENERDDFSREVENLTFKLDELAQSAGTGDAAALNTDNAYQVDFLNSVIVDQQKKIDELNAKVKLLAEVSEEGHNGYTEADYSDMSSLMEPGKPPPRLFCDICDVFDEHDTDDCPIQAQDDDGPPPTQYHEERHTQRAYCDTCEVFGHATEDCQEQDEW